jgi:hypothetical protein
MRSGADQFSKQRDCCGIAGVGEIELERATLLPGVIKPLASVVYFVAWQHQKQQRDEG